VHPSNGLCPGGLGRHIDEDDVRRGGVDDTNCLIGRPDLGDDLDVRLSIEDLPDPDPEDGARFDDDEADRLVGGRLWGDLAWNSRTSAARACPPSPSLPAREPWRMTRSTHHEVPIRPGTGGDPRPPEAHRRF
jgi:hypothetical protein